MANDYRILDERDIKNFQAGNKLEVTEIGNKVTYEHIGEPPNTLPSKEKVLEYGNAFNITVPSVYDSTGHVKSETKYSFIMPQETDTSNFLTTDNFLSESPIHIKKDGKNITYSHDKPTEKTSIKQDGPPQTAQESKISLSYGGSSSFTVLSGIDEYGHAIQNKTYTLEMPTAVNVSGFLKKDSFGDIDGNPVTKSVDGDTVIYSHDKPTVNTLLAKNGPPKTGDDVDIPLSYGKTTSFTALSGIDEYGHAIQKTEYNIKMPAAPDTSTIDTSEFLKKTDLGATFGAADPLHVDITNNVVTYSHTGSSPKENETASKSLAFGGTFDITVPSAYNSTGHVTATQPYTFTMPATPTIRECIGIGDTNSFYYYSSSDIGLNVTGLSTAEDSDLTTIYFVTFYPGAGYSKEVIENNTKYTCAVISPGPFTIPVATYQNATAAVEYTFQALKFYPPSHQSKTAEKIDYTVTIQLKGNAEDHTAWFDFTFPAGIFSKITVMGF